MIESMYIHYGDFGYFLVENQHLFRLWIKRSKKHIENANKLEFDCDVIGDVIIMRQPGNNSPEPESWFSTNKLSKSPI